MKNLHETIQATHFRYLDEDAIQNPFLFINQFCSFETEIELFREDIHSLIHAAAVRKTDHGGKFYLNSEDYVYNQKQIITAIEVLWVLNHQPEHQLSIANTHPLYQRSTWKRPGIDVKARIDNHAPYYRKLENQEINNIRIFLENFFLYRNLHEWREVLDDLLSYAHINQSILDETSLSSEFVPTYTYLEKMAEAIFLIADLNSAENHVSTENDEADDINTTQNIQETTLNQPITSLEDEHFTENLIQYLHKFWSYLEEDDDHHSYGTIVFTEALEQELLSYFESYDPTFLGRNFRRVYMGYLEHLFDTGTPYYYDELRAFTGHMDTFFELLDLAASETAHWPQENRIGWEEQV